MSEKAAQLQQYNQDLVKCENENFNEKNPLLRNFQF